MGSALIRPDSDVGSHNLTHIHNHNTPIHHSSVVVLAGAHPPSTAERRVSKWR